MFAIAFDLVVEDNKRKHPKGVAQAYTDIGEALHRFGFERIQGSVYVCEREDLANLFSAKCAKIAAMVCRMRARYSRVPYRAMVGLYKFLQNLAKKASPSAD
jgi:virulence-associated protein VapD